MMYFYLKAKVSIRVFGISGASQEGVSALTKAANVTMAKQKFEAYCRQKFAHMQFEGIHFEYIEVAAEIL
jgi:hypothetical protein